MYTMKTRVRFSEVGVDGRIKLPALVDYLQDCAIFHSEDIGFGVRIYDEEKRAWMLISWQIIIHELPKLGTELEIITNPYAFKRCMGNRNFLVKGTDGREYAIANSVWAYMDVENGRPARPEPEMIEAYQAGEPFAMDYASRKMSLPAEDDPDCKWSVLPAFTVLPHHLDTNHHVNNGQYVHMAYDYLTTDRPVRELWVNYTGQARLGDHIVPKVGVCADTEYVELMDENGKEYATAAFLL